MPARELETLPEELKPLFAPLDKRAFGLAVGVLCALGVFGITAYHLLLDDFLRANVDALAGREWYSGSGLWLLENYFKGYNPETWTGAFVGGLWGLWTGFVMGWFTAFARNLAVAVWLFTVRTKEQLASQREFLDHI